MSRGIAKASRSSAQMTFTHQTGDDDNKFISEGEDPVTVTLTEDERSHLVRRV